MDFTSQKELLQEYLRWKGSLKANDSSPEAFLVWKTREAAFDKLEEIDRYVNEFLEKHPGVESMKHIHKIINGE